MLDLTHPTFVVICFSCLKKKSRNTVQIVHFTGQWHSHVRLIFLSSVSKTSSVVIIITIVKTKPSPTPATVCDLSTTFACPDETNGCLHSITFRYQKAANGNRVRHVWKRKKKIIYNTGKSNGTWKCDLFLLWGERRQEKKSRAVIICWFLRQKQIHVSAPSSEKIYRQWEILNRTHERRSHASSKLIDFLTGRREN